MWDDDEDDDDDDDDDDVFEKYLHYHHMSANDVLSHRHAHNDLTFKACC